MTAVAPPLTFQAPNRTAWNSNSLNGLSHEELTRALNMQNPPQQQQQQQQPRKTTQRSNSSASLNSASSGSTISPSSANANGADAGGYTTRKKGRAMFVPIGKSEPTAGLSTARPQPVSSGSSGPSAASTISALHAPLLPSQQMTNGQAQQNGTLRNANPAQEPTAILHLLPMNSTFERKTITVPYFPDVLRIGRQTNQKTAPTPSNGFFDSKVLSRQHAEIYAERNNGRVFIRDVKSSNGTFVNGQRLSPENKESEPHPLQEQDVLELGIDIVSEDQKTVVHHKVAARVEHAGIYPVEMSFAELDHSSGGFNPTPQMKRNGSQSSTASAKANALAAVMQARDINGVSHFQQQARTMFTPITTETIVKRLNRELNLAKLQSHDLARSKQCLEALLTGDSKKTDIRSDKQLRPSSIKSKSDMKAHFSEPPAPPPQQPLPEKPDVAKALADPVIQPFLLKADTSRPHSQNASPTRPDHSQALLILTQELKLAKDQIDQIPNLEEHIKSLKEELQHERTARESAEELARQRLQDETPSESNGSSVSDPIPITGRNIAVDTAASTREPDADLPALQSRIDQLVSAMDDMKKHMEDYRRRAEIAESERDSAQQTLAEMVEQKRKENANAEPRRSRSRSSRANSPTEGTEHATLTNGHTVEPLKDSNITVIALLEKAGIKGDELLTKDGAATLRQLLAQHTLQLGAAQPNAEDGRFADTAIAIDREPSNEDAQSALKHYAWHLGPAFGVVLVGLLVLSGLSDRIDAVHR